MALPSTVGNWTIDAENVRPVQTLKSIQVADSRSTEFTASVTPADKASSLDLDQVLYYTDQTGAGLLPAGTLSVGRSRVGNIYSSFNTPVSARLPQTDGVRAYFQRIMKFSATNSVSGVEYEFPVRQNYSIVIPAWSAVPQDVVIYALQELLGDLFMGQGISNPVSVINALRGDIDLTR